MNINTPTPDCGTYHIVKGIHNLLIGADSSEPSLFAYTQYQLCLERGMGPGHFGCCGSTMNHNLYIDLLSDQIQTSVKQVHGWGYRSLYHTYF